MIHIDAPANHLLPIYEQMAIDQLTTGCQMPE